MSATAITTRQRDRVLALATEGHGRTEIARRLRISRSDVDVVLDSRHAPKHVPDPLEIVRYLARRGLVP